MSVVTDTKRIVNPSESATADAVEWTLAHGVAFKRRDEGFSTMHTPFALTPTPISRQRFEHLKSSVPLLGKLVHHASEDRMFLEHAIEPITSGDPFFRALWKMHQQLHKEDGSKDNDVARRLPLLIMRSDFMDDVKQGPKLIEFNGIAAGMGPFGQRIHELHQYIQSQWPETYEEYAAGKRGANPTNKRDELVENLATDKLADGIAEATYKIKNEFGDKGPPRFLMVVQEDEDNVFDQHLLEYALQKRGIQTVRKSYRELFGNFSTGPGHRLLMDGVGTVDTVYLRSGYLYGDFYASDLDGAGNCITNEKCCESLLKARVFLERHRVAMNATISQQMASSKRVQMLLSSMDAQGLTKFGLTLEEAKVVKDLLGEMLPVNAETSNWIEAQGSRAEEWVLKNQGEGGGHCLFGGDILPKLEQLKQDDYDAWSIMRRLYPKPRTNPTLLVRKGEPDLCSDLISEIGMFTVHVDGNPAKGGAKDVQGYAGYLIRSKPAQTQEGGVHSGQGVLDSLVYANDEQELYE